jgi:hypothetical protein
LVVVEFLAVDIAFVRSEPLLWTHHLLYIKQGNLIQFMPLAERTYFFTVNYNDSISGELHFTSLVSLWRNQESLFWLNAYIWINII